MRSEGTRLICCPSCFLTMNATSTLRRVWSTTPGKLTTWRRCFTTFTGCEYRNKSRFGWQFRRTADRMDLHHGTSLVTFTRWRRSSHGDGCVRRRLRHWSSQPRRVLRSAIALSLSLPLGRGTAFRSRLRHQHTFQFSSSIWRQFYLLAPFRRSKTFLSFILSPCFILQFYVFFYRAFSL